MYNKNLISKSIISTCILITFFFLLLTTYMGYRLPMRVPLVSLIKSVKLYDDQGIFVRSFSIENIDQNNLSGASKASILFDFSTVNLSSDEWSLYITPIQNPIRVFSMNKVLLDIGDFENKKPLMEQDFSIDLKILSGIPDIRFDIERNVIKGSELDFIFNSGIASKNSIETVLV